VDVEGLYYRVGTKDRHAAPSPASPISFFLLAILSAVVCVIVSAIVPAAGFVIVPAIVSTVVCAIFPSFVYAFVFVVFIVVGVTDIAAVPPTVVTGRMHCSATAVLPNQCDVRKKSHRALFRIGVVAALIGKQA